MLFLFHRKNTGGKEEKFLLFPQCFFQSSFPSGHYNLEVCFKASTLSLLILTQEDFVDSVDQDKTAQNIKSDL